MARKRRIEFPGAFYHVFARGNNRQKIFRDDMDYFSYLDRIKRYHRRHGFKLYVFALMPNHVHMVIEMIETPLSKIMQGLQQSFTLYFHKRYESVGHVFQGRYGAALCEREEYLLSLVSYIHLNPVFSGLVDFPYDYPWSSHHVYMGENNFSIVESNFVLCLFAEEKCEARRKYLKFLQKEMGKKVQSQIFNDIDQRFYGNQEYVERVKEKLMEKIRPPEEQIREIKEPLPGGKTLEDILKIVSKATTVSCGSILGESREADICYARAFYAYTVSRYFGVENKKIAEFLSRDPSTVTHMVHKMNDCLKKETEWVEILNRVIQVFKA
jgi:REP element-mobilizing transposase RayT